MSTATPAIPISVRTFADLLRELGDIPPERIRFHPAPGTATEQDVVSIQERKTDPLCELFDGVLVEKPLGFRESSLAFWLVYFLASYLKEHDLGLGLESAGLMRVAPGQVRIPDVAFYPWNLFPGRVIPKAPILDLVPSLAVEILSPTNSKREMARKRREYLEGGCKMVWEVEPDSRQVRVYRSVDEFVILEDNDMLDGADVLPGFQVSIKQWFTMPLKDQK